MSDEIVGVADTANGQIPVDVETINPTPSQDPAAETAPDPAPPPATEEVEGPVSMKLAPPGYRVSRATRLYSMRDEPGALSGAQVIEVPEGAQVGRGKMELDRGGKTYVTSVYNGTHGWSPASYLEDD